jgi:RNA polymerase sigma factor (sigma-70 family)
MSFPDTPKSVIELLGHPSGGGWQHAWKRFFDLYHAPIQVMTRKAFWKCGWYHVDAALEEDLIATVLAELHRVFMQREVGSETQCFRGLLKMVVFRRVQDYIRKRHHKVEQLVDPTDPGMDMLDAVASTPFDHLEQEEMEAYRFAVMMDAYEAVRCKFSPRTCLVFEMVKLQNRPPATVMKELGVSRSVVDNAVYKLTRALRETLEKEPYSQELEA